MGNQYTGTHIRQTFIDYFIEHGHTMVPSSSLVPGGDQTLLFTNAGMVQFKDVFLGTDKRPYNRAVNSQKCMRVAGKHNDLEDVGFDDTHHTFFEMLGNWSFGDYYKKEAITWAWDLLTRVWQIPAGRLYATCFQDEKDQIERDDEAAACWRSQPGIDLSHILFFGRKDNFWEMAETGPCGPCSEIHLDRGEQYCDMKDIPGHFCQVNGACQRYLELWNLVFIQYNRTGPTSLEPLPAKHVDTGMGLERVVSILQEVNSNYQTDLFSPVMDKIQELTGDDESERSAHLTPYRVIADHTRAATFLIADGVVPGNTGRNYVCRMIIRRAARFGAKIRLVEPFLASVADVVIGIYGGFYPELTRNRLAILANLTREENRFRRTVEGGLGKLESLLEKLRAEGGRVLPGESAFSLYATYGLPLEITRDIAVEDGLEVDEVGFHNAMDEHRLASGGGEAFGSLGGEDVDMYREVVDRLQAENRLATGGVVYDPYSSLEAHGPVLALIRDGIPVESAETGDILEVLLPFTCFYVEAGGQVSDTGVISSYPESGNTWTIGVEDMRKPAAGVIVHVGRVLSGKPSVGDEAVARVDTQRRHDIMRNHTATHLLHAELQSVLGAHARQAGSLVAPDRLRFDFTHPEAVTPDQLERIEAGINRNILNNNPLHIVHKPLQQAVEEGAIALFGEKYAETVRTISIFNPPSPASGKGQAAGDIGSGQRISYELCGGTHVDETGDIGVFIITSEGSAAAGIRRIEAVTGRCAYELIQKRFKALKEAATALSTTPEGLPVKVRSLLEEQAADQKTINALRREMAMSEFSSRLDDVPRVSGIPVLSASIPGSDADLLRQMADRFRQKYPTGVAVLASTVDERPLIIAAITDDLVGRGFHAADLVKFVAGPLGGSGGGKPTLAQAGGKDATRLEEALARVAGWVNQKASQ